MNKSEQDRLFIAASLAPAQHVKLLQAQKNLSLLAETMSITKPENLHMTLRFIGEVDRNISRRIRQELQQISVEEIDKFTARILKLDRFIRRDGDLVYAELEVSPALQELVDQLERVIRSITKPESKPWLAHVTLARRVTFKNRQPKLPIIESETHQVLDGIHLYRSEFTPQGMRYTPIMKIL